MATSGTVRVIKDTKGAGLDALMKRLQRGEHRVLVGVPSGAGNEENGLSLAAVAAINEFGATVAPHSRIHRQLMRRSPRTGRLIGAAEQYEGFRGPGKGKQGPAQRVTKTRNATAILQLAKAATFSEGITIPARPVLRGGIRTNLARFSRLSARLLKQVAQGAQTLRGALEVVGHDAVGAVKRYFVTGGFEPNAPSTIKKKGSSRPLIDDGQYRQAITHVVEGKTR
jgi:hypothetical protein